MLKKKLGLSIIIIIILVSLNIPFINSTTEEGYGEGNDNLGQFTDTFENTNNITVMDDVIRNATLECIELNATVGNKRLYEDFTIYTQVEEGNEIDVQNATYVEFWDDRKKTSYLYHDYGVDYFENFTHFIDFYRDAHQASSFLNLWMMSNYLGGVKELRVAVRDYIYFVVSGSTPIIRLYEHTGGNFYQSANVVISLDTWYYVNITKEGIEIYLNVYSTYALREIGGNGDVLSTSLTLQANYKMRYIYAGNTYDDGGNFLGKADFRNYWYGTELLYETDGYFITEDYLNYTTGNSLTLLTNTSIPYDTLITVQFSNDNSTWVDNEGNVGSTSIEEGFYSIDLRDLNYSDIFSIYNFSGTGALTPRLYQSRLVTTNGSAINGVSAPSEDYAGLLIVGLILGLIIGIGASRA